MTRAIFSCPLILLLSTFTACGAPAPSVGRSGAKPAAESAPAEQTPTASARKLIKTVDLEVRVSDTLAAAERLRELSEELGGYVSSMTAYRRDELLYYRMTLRVPVERLDEAVQQIKRSAERVERESIRTEDVTERYVDLEARLTTLKATETELRHLLSESREREQRAEDIMAIYEKLTEIRTGIEQIEGQMKSLDALAALSTVNVELIPTEGARPIVSDAWRPGDTVRASSRALVMILQGIANLAIVLAIVGLPLGLLFGLPALAMVWSWRRRRRRHPPDSR